MEPVYSTQDKLLSAAKTAFWTKGYSNVSVREIAKAASVDVALISRYFGSKLGLFEATLDGAFDLGVVPATEAELIELFVGIFVTAPRDCVEVSPLGMLLINAGDAAVGPLARAQFEQGFQRYVVDVIGDPARSALLMSAVFGISVAEKTLKLRGIADYDTVEYAAQLRHMMGAALRYSAPS